MTSLIDQAFESLFYGAGSWLGLLLFVVLIISISSKVKYSGAILLPVSVFMFLNYTEHELFWHGIVIIFAGIYAIIMTGLQAKGGE